MKLTIGMPSYNNFTEVFFTVQALRIYHDLTDCEILIVDNYGDSELDRFVKNQGAGKVRCIRYTDKIGPSHAKNKIFEHAQGDMVLCIDSHILLKPGALNNIPVSDDLIQGPLMYNDIGSYCCEWLPEWRGHMWGIWGKYLLKLPQDPFEIWGMGAGLLLTKRSSWLGYNDKFRGFGGEEGYIHEKYRKAGRKVWCYPNIVWMHMFDKKIPYPLNIIDRVCNYITGFKELGLDSKDMENHFGEALIKEAQALMEKEEIVV